MATTTPLWQANTRFAMLSTSRLLTWRRKATWHQQPWYSFPLDGMIKNRYNRIHRDAAWTWLVARLKYVLMNTAKGFLGQTQIMQLFHKSLYMCGCATSSQSPMTKFYFQLSMWIPIDATDLGNIGIYIHWWYIDICLTVMWIPG